MWAVQLSDPAPRCRTGETLDAQSDGMTGTRQQDMQSHTATCQCGKVAIETALAPILVAACCCTDCQKAGHAFESMPSASPVLDDYGGTPYVVYRKDRITCRRGREHLREYRLKPESPTRRVLAACCNSAMFVDFTKGHWLSLCQKRFGPEAPPVEMRLMTRGLSSHVALDDDVPNYPGRPASFMWKLIATWAAMGFRVPDMGMAHLPRSNFDSG